MLKARSRAANIFGASRRCPGPATRAASAALPLRPTSRSVEGSVDRHRRKENHPLRSKGIKMCGRSQTVRDGPIRFGPALAMMIAIIAPGGAAHAAEDEFYRGKQIRLILSSGPGGV